MTTAVKTNSNPQLVEQLKRVLSDTYVLLIKTHGYHWNVTGPQFSQLHLLFEGQYTELFAAVDEVAERLRALNAKAPGSMGAFLQNTVVKESGEPSPDAMAMVKELLESHEKVRERVSEACNVAGELGDKATEDLMIGRLTFHDKTMWMLRSLLAP